MMTSCCGARWTVSGGGRTSLLPRDTTQHNTSQHSTAHIIKQRLSRQPPRSDATDSDILTYPHSHVPYFLNNAVQMTTTSDAIAPMIVADAYVVRAGVHTHGGTTVVFVPASPSRVYPARGRQRVRHTTRGSLARQSQLVSAASYLQTCLQRATVRRRRCRSKTHTHSCGRLFGWTV